MTKTLKLAPNLELPLSAVTDTWAWFGARGTGKTYGAGSAVEGLLGLGLQVVVVDPVGVWYGLRLAADGRGRGLDIPVFGGLHGDVPLEPTGGDLVAQLVVERGVSVVLDVSMMTLGQQHRFVNAFATALFNLKKSNRTPIFVLFDEAHEFMPQSPGPQEAEMLSNVRRLWKMGRNFGIGTGLISPRPAEVNKGVVNLTERMFCGRLKGPHDRKAMESWATSQEVDDSALDQLASLPSGQLMYWGDKGPTVVRFFAKKTFDASKTPEAGSAARAAAELPKIDLAAVRDAMAATIEEAKANDPRALRTRIADLERLLAERPTTVPPEKVVTKLVIPASLPSISGRLGAAARDSREALRLLGERMGLVEAGLIDLVREVATAQKANLYEIKAAPHATAPIVHSSKSILKAAGSAMASAPPIRPTKAARAVLTALAQHREGLTRRKLGILAGYAPGGTSMREALALCRKEMWADDLAGGMIVIGNAGLAALGEYKPLPTGADLRDYWYRELPKAARRILVAIVDAHPHGLTKQGIADATAEDGQGESYAAGGTSMREALAMLRGLELVDDVGDRVIAVPDLF